MSRAKWWDGSAQVEVLYEAQIKIVHESIWTST
jgi:hypothetical protein